MNILLTGAFGNIGSSTLQALLQEGHSVRCFDIQTSLTKKMASRFEKQKGVEIYWSDLRNVEQVEQAVQGQEVILHFGAILPPMVDKNLEKAEAVNVGGTQNLINAALKQTPLPRFLLASTLDIFGHTQDQEPPRRVTDPIQATDAYSQHKIVCEEIVKSSGLEWSIFRFADVPPLSARSVDPIMFRIPLATRFEMLHTHDAGLAVANGMKSPIWGHLWLIGGGKTCQVTYRDYLNGSLEIAGLGTLPDEAFGHDPYCTDWLDTEESQALLQYQRHTFEQIMQDSEAPFPFLKLFMFLLRPIIRQSLLKMSPYWSASKLTAAGK